MKRILNHAPVLISLVLATFYALGLMYHHSFLKAFGIEETQFPLSIDRIFYQGFFAFAELTAPNVIFVVFCASGVVITAYLAILVVELAKRINVVKPILSTLQKAFTKNTNKVELSPALENFAEFSTKVFWYVCAGVLAYLSVLLVLIAAEHAGKANAKRYKDKIINNQVAIDRLMVEVSKGEFESFEGYSIVCNSLQCAYFDGVNSSVFNHSAVYSLRSKPISQ
jgi:hypothetical protein